MKEWPRVQLGDVAQVVMGQSPPGDTYNEAGDGLPFFQGKADFGERFPTTRKWCSAPARIAEPGDILLSVRAPVGPTNVARERCCIGRGLAAIRSVPALAHQDYLHLFLRYLEPALSLQGQGSTFSAIGRSEVETLRVGLPPLSEQRRIAEILERTDRLRRLRSEANSRSSRIPPALFLRMFGDPARNPMGWPTVRVGDVADVQGGLQLSRKRELHPIPVPYLRVANVYRDRLELGEIKVLGVTESELERTRLATGDVLVVEGHGNKSEIGRCAVWNGAIDPCVHQNHLIRVRSDRSQVVPRFVSAYLNSAAGRQQLLKAGKTTSGLNTISVSNVKKATLFLPPLERQECFDQALSSASVVSIHARSSTQKLELLWRQLLAFAFSGELTATWREGHMRELQQELEAQASALRGMQ